jgi:hypothetical protein
MFTTPMTSVRPPSARARLRSCQEVIARETAFITQMVARPSCERHLLAICGADGTGVANGKLAPHILLHSGA